MSLVKIQLSRVGTMVNNMRCSIMLDALPPLPACIQASDLNDAFLLAMALGGKADYLVTGDHRAGLLQRDSMGRTRILTPATFCAESVLMKSTAEKERACRTLCAFANGDGGRVLFGVTPAGKAVGQSVSDRTLEELAQEFQHFEPPLFPTVRV